MLKNRKANQWYVEPFVGGCNMIDKIEGKRLGNDIDCYLIELYRALIRGWIPPTEISYELYTDIKDNKSSYDPWLVQFVGYGCTFGAKWFGGLAHNKEKRNFALGSKKILMQQLPKIKDVIFMNVNYWQIPLPSNSIIYCDPPYANTTRYRTEFDHDKFWNWVREISHEHEVYVSEYQAPKDFKCLLEIDVTTQLDRNKKKSRVERLFKYNP